MKILLLLVIQGILFSWICYNGFKQKNPFVTTFGLFFCLFSIFGIFYVLYTN